MRAKKLVTALAAAIIMLTPITASAINLDVCQGTTAQQMTCTAHLLRSKGEPELAAQLEMIALQIERGLLTAREGDALAGKVIDARNRAISFETIGKSLEMIFRRTEPPPPPPAFRMSPTCHAVQTVDGRTVSVCQ